MSTTDLPAPSTETHDGYFTPDSISWRVFADPASKLGGMAALLLQALNPYMMRVFYNATASHEDATGRDERTGRYFETVVFGDKAHADKASEVVRRMHAHARWTDPATGEELRADTPQWLAWTHNTFVYALVCASRAFGVPLTDAEVEQFIVEQLAAARLIGIEDETLLPHLGGARRLHQRADVMALAQCRSGRGHPRPAQARAARQSAHDVDDDHRAGRRAEHPARLGAPALRHRRTPDEPALRRAHDGLADVARPEVEARRSAHHRRDEARAGSPLPAAAGRRSTHARRVRWEAAVRGRLPEAPGAGGTEGRGHRGPGGHRRGAARQIARGTAPVSSHASSAA